MTYHQPKKKRSRFRFIGEIVSELKKVVWLSRREVVYLTSMVILVAGVIGLFLGAIDFGFANLIRVVFLGG